jgi:hypothetical protein
MEPTGFAGYRSRRTAARSSPWQADQPAHDRAPGRQPPQTGSPCTADVSAPIRRKRETLRHQRVALFRKPTGHRASDSGPCVTRRCRWVVDVGGGPLQPRPRRAPATGGIGGDDLGGGAARFLATRPPREWHRGIARWNAIPPPTQSRTAPRSAPDLRGWHRCRTCISIGATMARTAAPAQPASA